MTEACLCLAACTVLPQNLWDKVHYTHVLLSQQVGQDIRHHRLIFEAFELSRASHIIACSSLLGRLAVFT
jgi:hypothetical protein